MAALTLRAVQVVTDSSESTTDMNKLFFHKNAAMNQSLASFNTPRTIDPKFFGQHLHGYPGSASKPDLAVTTVRSHDYSYLGKTISWNKIETSKGVFDWVALDLWVSANEAAGWDMVYVFAFSPDWAVVAAATGAAAYGGKSDQPPTNDTDWTDFITAVVTRYGTRIKYYQGWNEPNLPKYYVGTASRLATLQRLVYQTVKALQPSLTVVSPSYTSVFSGVTGLAAYLAASDGIGGTGKSWFDILGYHFYCNDDSKRLMGLSVMWDGVQAAMTTAGISVPVWATETGLINPSLKTYSDAGKVLLLETYMLSLAVLGVERVMYYGYDDVLIGFNDSAACVAAWNALAGQVAGQTFGSGSIYVFNGTRYTVKLGGITRVVADTPL